MDKLRLLKHNGLETAGQAPNVDRSYTTTLG